MGRGDPELCESTETSHAADDVSGPGLQFPGAPLRMEMHHLSYYCVSVGGWVLFSGLLHRDCRNSTIILLCRMGNYEGFIFQSHYDLFTSCNNRLPFVANL